MTVIEMSQNYHSCLALLGVILLIISFQLLMLAFVFLQRSFLRRRHPWLHIHLFPDQKHYVPDGLCRLATEQLHARSVCDDGKPPQQ